MEPVLLSRAADMEKATIKKSNKAAFFLIFTVVYMCGVISAPYIWPARWVYVLSLIMTSVTLPLCMHYFAKLLLRGQKSWEEWQTTLKHMERQRDGSPPVKPVV